ncbi:dihydrolipoyl dehydrogenase family protein [Weissella paramesenteroides]|uniref:dihydrolipoyl dehydrogenase family protein n=1 Tax=Weissella paramesenteroides TaxID=1249 RepID=UPI003F747C26
MKPVSETKQYDVAIIGAGPAGLAAAHQLHDAGKQVVVIEKYLWGGTCPNYGCDPKKILLGAVEAKESTEFLSGSGIDGQVNINWPDLMARKNQYTKGISTGTEQSLTASDIDHIAGEATFIDEQTAIINQNGQGDVTVSATDWIIAVGQRPAKLSFPGSELTIDSEKFLSLPELPDEVVIIGGGFVAIEFASIAAAAGAKVSLIVRGERLLKSFDETMVDSLMDQLDDRGVQMYFGTEVTEITSTDNGLEATLSFGNTLSAGLIVRAAGRVGNHDTLDLDKAHVQFSEKGVLVDQHLRTSNAHIYAVGDVANSPVPKITPLASFESKHATNEILGQSQPITYPAVPVVVYGTPKLAQTGVTTETASQDGYTVHDLDISSWYTSYRTGEPAARVKTVLNHDGQLIGASVLSSHADELINYLTLAINQGLTKETVSKQLYAYPSVASDLSYFF